jgi:hypothetical protein
LSRHIIIGTEEKKMKKFGIVVLVLFLAAIILPGSASAANSLKQGTFGFNVDVNNNFFGLNSDVDNNFVLTGKFFIYQDLAVLAGAGIGIRGADAKGVDLGITAGLRKYLKVDDFAPFIGGTFFYSTTKDGDAQDFSLLGEAGVEYFLHKQFSIEGKIGAGYVSRETKTTTTTPQGGFLVQTSTTTRESDFGTERLGISFNFYF